MTVGLEVELITIRSEPVVVLMISAPLGAAIIVCQSEPRSDSLTDEPTDLSDSSLTSPIADTV